MTEIIREKLWMALNQEIPYGLGQEHSRWEDDGTVLLVEHAVLVSSEHLKPIVIGAGGKVITRVHKAAHAEIEAKFGRHVGQGPPPPVQSRLLHAPHQPAPAPGRALTALPVCRPVKLVISVIVRKR